MPCEDAHRPPDVPRDAMPSQVSDADTGAVVVLERPADSDTAEDERRDYELYCREILGCEPDDWDPAPLRAPSVRWPPLVVRAIARPLARARGRRVRRARPRRAPARSPGSREPEPPPRPLDL